MMIRCDEIECPVCGRKADGCLVGNRQAICVRTVSDRQCGTAGYLHQVDITLPAVARKQKKKRPANINWKSLHKFYKARVKGTPPYSALDCGWNGGAWTIPMYNAQLQITGFQRVFPDRSKRFVHGSQPGVFLASERVKNAVLTGHFPHTVMITEGMGDTNVAEEKLGYCTIGRSSCNQSVGIIGDLLTEPKQVIVIPDNDPPGLAGGRKLVMYLLERGHNVVSIIPPTHIRVHTVVKDLSDWVERDGKQIVYEVIHDQARRGEPFCNS